MAKKPVSIRKSTFKKIKKNPKVKGKNDDWEGYMVAPDGWVTQPVRGA